MWDNGSNMDLLSRKSGSIFNKDHDSPYRKLKVRGIVGRPISYIVIIVLVLGVALTLLNIYELNKMREDYAAHIQAPVVEAKEGKYGTKQHIVWVEGKNKHTGYLKHVFDVFDRIGYAAGDGESDWDVLWSHEYPFEILSKKISNIKPHQRINHFPGSGYITNKVYLATTNSSFIPLAFKIPSEKKKFLDYTQKHPDKMWVQKKNTHRGIQIKKTTELDLENEGSFVQLYVDNPFLIDDRKFDIGIYAIITSIDPLRVYIVDDEALFRFCSRNYYPFDPADTKKYVVDDDYTPMWQMPSLLKYFTDMEYSFKESFNMYLRSKGLNYEKVWDDVRSTVATVAIQKEEKFIQTLQKYKNSRNFFEMMRFDVVLDENLNVYLMEVNMSPNLSSAHFPPNARLYEHVIFNLLSLVGVARSVTNSFENSSEDERAMVSSNKDITVFSDWCSSPQCVSNCKPQLCQLCHPCLTLELKKILKAAFQEHRDKRGCRRVFPSLNMTQNEAREWKPDKADETFSKLNAKNKVMYMWFVGKCQQDQGWCI